MILEVKMGQAKKNKRVWEVLLEDYKEGTLVSLDGFRRKAQECLATPHARVLRTLTSRSAKEQDKDAWGRSLKGGPIFCEKERPIYRGRTPEGHFDFRTGSRVLNRVIYQRGLDFPHVKAFGPSTRWVDVSGQERWNLRYFWLDSKRRVKMLIVPSKLPHWSVDVFTRLDGKVDPPCTVISYGSKER